MRIVSAAKKGVAYFVFDYDPVLVAVARGIPSHRKWNPEYKHWEFKLTEPAVQHILKHCPACELDADIKAFMAERAESRQQAKQMKSTSVGITSDNIRDYRFKTKPFDHQAEAFMRSRDMEAFALFMEQGTGKTKVVIDTAAYLFAKGEIDSLVVACPNSVKTNWVLDELQAHLPDWVEYDAAYWESRANKAERLALEKLNDKNGRLKVLVINVEALSNERPARYAINFCRMNRPLLVVDESSRVKKYSAERSKTCRKMATHCSYRRILSGTPITQSPLDLYSQMAVLDENILGYSSFYAFRNRFAIMGGFENKQIIGYQNLDELSEIIEPYSFRVLKKDCLTLPEKLYQKIEIEHTPEQKRVYKNMRKNLITDLANGNIASASIALVKLGKLQQINSNFVMDDDMNVSVIDPTSNPRLDTLVELLSDHGGKAIIWARYKYDIQVITAELKRVFGDASTAAFYGDVSMDERLSVRQAFQDKSNELDFFVGNPAAGGIGLTLTEASLVVYYSNDFSLESRLQSEDRAHRIGQTKAVTYVDFVTPNTIDAKIVKALREKRAVASLVTKDGLGEWI